MRKLVVYGTLKYGMGADLSTWANKNKRLKEITLDGWEMYTNGSYPMCIPGDGVIHAELWEIEEKCLPTLDSYEGHPNLFKRTPIEVDGEEAFIYQYMNPISKFGWFNRIESGVFY